MIPGINSRSGGWYSDHIVFYTLYHKETFLLFLNLFQNSCSKTLRTYTKCLLTIIGIKGVVYKKDHAVVSATRMSNIMHSVWRG